MFYYKLREKIGIRVPSLLLIHRKLSSTVVSFMRSRRCENTQNEYFLHFKPKTTAAAFETFVIVAFHSVDVVPIKPGNFRCKITYRSGVYCVLPAHQIRT